MAFFRKLFSAGGKSKKKDYPNIIQSVDPLESWKKVGELGDGAFGKVFKTEHMESGKFAAMKRVPIQDDTELDDFMVEIDILAECKHRNIVGLHEAYFYDQALWIYIEFCAGGAMDDIIIELDHGLSEPQISCICRQLFEALSFLHASYCIHRDLKAGNILLCADGSIRLADFGVSTKDSAKGRQKHDTFIGTPYWMAPEVVVCETIKDDPYNSAADIWSAGITMIELADMNPPYHEMSPMRVLQKIVKKESPTVDIPSRWSTHFNNMLALCLMKSPSGRPSAAQLLEHPFIADVSDNKPLRILYQEVKSEVEEIVEELPEDADLLTDPGHSEQLISVSSSKEPSPPPQEVSSPQEPTPPPQEPTPPPTPPPQEPSPPPQEPSPPSQEPTPPPQEPTPPPQEHSLTSNSPPPESPVGPEAVAFPAPANSDLGPEASRLEPSPVTPSPSAAPPSSIETTPSPMPERGQSSKLQVGQGKGEDEEGKSVHKYATLSRVRKFKVDGQVHESTTRKIVDVTANKTLRDNKRYQQMRKQDFRELKQLQREEMKEATEFYGKIKVNREIQEKKFEIENAEVERGYENQLELIGKRQKKEIERQESQHIQQFKSRLKYVKSQQSKDMKRFKDNMKEEEKLAVKKVEVSVSKPERKVAVNQAKLELQAKRMDKEAAFCGKQSADMEGEVKQILKDQKEERKTLELSFLDARQDLRRSHTSSLWEKEQRQKQDHNQLQKQQLREAFHMQRHQMHIRHQIEVELQGRRDQFQLEELRQKQLLEKRQLPKTLKADHKQKVAEARKAMRNKKADKDSLKKLDEQYVQLCQLETELMNDRHEKEMETLRVELEANMRELQEIQNEKKMQLTQQETNKVKERDELHTVELREWRVEIAKRKQKLEEEFRASRDEQEQFYSLDRPIPKQLRFSLSMPGSSVSRNDRSIKALSTASMEDTQGGASRSRPPLQPLDEVVMGTPILNRVPPTDSADNTALQRNGSMM